MRIKLLAVIAIFGLAMIIIPATASANLVLNGDFEDGLNHWTSVGEVMTTNFVSEGFYSPSGDMSDFAFLVTRDYAPNATLQQIVDMTAASPYRMTMDFTIATYEPSWGDDFRAELWINYPGGGPYTPIFSYGSGSGVFADWAPVPGMRYYTVQGFTYDFYWGEPMDNLVLDFHMLGYAADEYQSGLMLDNVSVTAIPEPGTVSLLILGLGFAAMRLRRKK